MYRIFCRNILQDVSYCEEVLLMPPMNADSHNSLAAAFKTILSCNIFYITHCNLIDC